MPTATGFDLRRSLDSLHQRYLPPQGRPAIAPGALEHRMAQRFGCNPSRIWTLATRIRKLPAMTNPRTLVHCGNPTWAMASRAAPRLTICRTKCQPWTAPATGNSRSSRRGALKSCATGFSFQRQQPRVRDVKSRILQSRKIPVKGTFSFGQILVNAVDHGRLTGTRAGRVFIAHCPFLNQNVIYFLRYCCWANFQFFDMRSGTTGAFRSRLLQTKEGW